MIKINTTILSAIKDTSDIRALSIDELVSLASEVRQETIFAVSETGGHLGAGLGVVELTVALHHVFNTPKDKIIWDVGHQTYPHKILTGRWNKISTLRKPGGLSGFTKRSESPYDSFGAGHSSTSVSAALGMAIARDLKLSDKILNQNDSYFESIAVIGDGAMSAGMAYEAMNNAGAMHTRMIVILNDNKMSIAPAVGAMSNYLSRLISSKPYLTLRNMAKKVAHHLPEAIEKAAKKAEQYTKDFWAGGNFFEAMGFYYVGPVDGHNLHHLVPILKNIKNDHSITRPILVHVVTEKGRGFDVKDAGCEKLHAVAKFDIKTREQKKMPSGIPTYTEIFSNSLINEAKKDDKIIAITAAMPSGTGLDKFADHFPGRMFDVGIAEQHAVTFAAGMACEGYKPFCAIYSTFLQRAYDQIIHDVVIQNLPVRFAIDRAGLVGADGPTHAGSFDITFLATLPNIVVMAPSDEAELVHMVATAVNYNAGPIAFRYPRGEGTGVDIPQHPQILPIGKGRIVRESAPARENNLEVINCEDDISELYDVAILSLGTRLGEALKAAQIIDKEGFSVTVADARFAKPLDGSLITLLARKHRLLITIEEGAAGGFGAHVLQFLSDHNLLNNNLNVKTLCLPDCFIEQNTAEAMYQQAALDADNIAELIRKSIAEKPNLLKEVV